MEFLGNGRIATEAEIKALEKEMNITLPDDYKAFLMKNNGYVSEKIMMFSFCEIDPENGQKYDMETDIQNFSSINEIPFFYKNLIGAKAIPEKYLSIACDSCGNEILLNVNQGEDYGKVFFGNHEIFQPETGLFNLSLVADSFREFCEMIYEG